MSEEPDLPLDPATISYKFTTRTDDSMTRDDDDNVIVVIGSTDSTDSRCSPDHTSLFTVAASLSVWDFLESLPGVSLKIRTIDSEWDREFFSLTCEVFSEFLLCLLEENICF